MVLRPPRAGELGRLQAIEIAAGAAFRAAGMEAIADDPPPETAVPDAFRADGQAAVTGAAALSLTTFRDVAWNAPYYARLGFAVVDPADQGPQLRALVAEEAAAIPGDAPRVAMRRTMPG